MGMTVWDSVDVETEWNLKFHGGVVDKIYAMVDVETEWNLKALSDNEALNDIKLM